MPKIMSFVHLLSLLTLILSIILTIQAKQCGLVSNGQLDPFGLFDQLTGNFKPPVPREPIKAQPVQPRISERFGFNPWLAFLGRRTLQNSNSTNSDLSNPESFLGLPTAQHLASELLSEEVTLKRVRRIVGGYDATFGQLCWQAKVHIGNAFDETLCGGSVIGSRTLLIAAHCLFNENTKRRVSDRMVKVIVGGMDRDVKWPFGMSSNTRCAQQFSIERSVVHPEYNYDMNNNDIAILTLRGQIDLESSPCVCAVCLTSRIPNPGEWCVVSGYGEEDNNGKNDRDPVPLKWTQLQVRPNGYDGTCAFNSIRSLSGNSLVQRTNLDLFICAGTQRWQDTCQGDSGGPLVCLDPVRRSYYQAGITSFGDDCGSGLGGQYTKVALYIQWILNVATPGDITL